MDPTPEKSLAPLTLNAVAGWVQLAHRPVGEGEDDSPSESFDRALGALPGLHLASCSGARGGPRRMPAAWRVSEAAPTAVVRNQGGMVGRICRVVCGIQLRTVDRNRQQTDLLQLQIHLAHAASALLPVQSQTVTGVAAVRSATGSALWPTKRTTRRLRSWTLPQWPRPICDTRRLREALLRLTKS